MSVYHRPKTLDEAIEIYAANPALKVLAGGTDVYPMLASCVGWGDMTRPGVLDISGIQELHGIVDAQDQWSIGPMATWSDILAADLPPLFDGLKAAARAIGGAQIQNRGTIGGNICNASPAADGVAVLLTLRAAIWSSYPYAPRSKQGEPSKPIVESIDFKRILGFFTGNRRTALNEGGIVTNIVVEAESGRGYFKKLGARNSLVISIAMVAAVFDWDHRGNVSKARVVVGACSPVAQRLSALEETLRGKPLDPALVRPEHFAQLTPIDDVRASAAYRRAAALQLVKDVIAEAAGDRGGGRG